MVHTAFHKIVVDGTQICYNCRSFDNSSVFALFVQRLEFVPGQKLNRRGGGHKYVLTADLHKYLQIFALFVWYQGKNLIGGVVGGDNAMVNNLMGALSGKIPTSDVDVDGDGCPLR